MNKQENEFQSPEEAEADAQFNAEIRPQGEGSSEREKPMAAVRSWLEKNKGALPMAGITVGAMGLLAGVGGSVGSMPEATSAALGSLGIIAPMAGMAAERLLKRKA